MTILGFIDWAPRLSLFGSIAALAVLAFVTLNVRWRLMLLSALVLAPCLPVLGLRLAAMSIVWACDWIVTCGRWSPALHRHADRFDRLLFDDTPVHERARRCNAG